MMIKYCKYCGKQIAINKTFCNNSCAASFNNKVRGSRSADTKRKISESLKERSNEIKDKKDKVLPTVFRVCEYCGSKFEVKRTTRNRLTKTKFCSKECRNMFLSKINKEIGSGGFREGSVKNYKSGWFNSIHCDSSWELAFLIWHKDHNIDVKRCRETRYYSINEKEYKYFPDFVVNDKIYELKGINDDVSKAKQKYNPDVVFLYREDIEKYINYAKKTYGNFIKLYDKKDK